MTNVAAVNDASKGGDHPPSVAWGGIMDGPSKVHAVAEVRGSGAARRFVTRCGRERSADRATAGTIEPTCKRCLAALDSDRRAEIASRQFVAYPRTF